MKLFNEKDQEMLRENVVEIFDKYFDLIWRSISNQRNKFKDNNCNHV